LVQSSHALIQHAASGKSAIEVGVFLKHVFRRVAEFFLKLT
jgi:hypothetical protein